MAAESWVLGRTLKIDPDSDQMRELEHDVIALYEADYAKAWNTMLADLNLAPMHSLTQAAQELFIISSEQSPMRSLLTSIARQLTLSKPPETGQGRPARVVSLTASDTEVALAATAWCQAG